MDEAVGTSVEMISQTCGHLVPDSEEYLRAVLTNMTPTRLRGGR
jgi:hypothetical protein